MIVFKAFLNIVKKYKVIIIGFSIMLVVFGCINMKTNDNSSMFSKTLPDIAIINNDSNGILSKNLYDYMAKNSNIKIIKEENIDDAIFYRDVNYVIYIPKNYSIDIINGKDIPINIKSTKDYNASVADMLLKRYISVQNIYKSKTNNEETLKELVNKALEIDSTITVIGNIDTDKVGNASSYFSFASYSIMASVIYVICLVMSSFNNRDVRKRMIVSSTNYKKINKNLLLSSSVYALILWVLYVLLGVIILKDFMFTTRGVIYILNLLIFTFVSLTIALLISTAINNKNAISGIVNVVSLGQAFLCGAFVPAEFLPKFVLNIAHIFPAYYYINTNNLLTTILDLNIESLKPVITNSLIMILFMVIFIVINNILTKYKQKI